MQLKFEIIWIGQVIRFRNDIKCFKHYLSIYLSISVCVYVFEWLYVFKPRFVSMSVWRRLFICVYYPTTEDVVSLLNEMKANVGRKFPKSLAPFCACVHPLKVKAVVSSSLLPLRRLLIPLAWRKARWDVWAVITLDKAQAWRKRRD